MKTIITFIQIQLLSCMFIGPIAACLLPFDGTLFGIVFGAGVVATVLLKQRNRIAPALGEKRPVQPTALAFAS